MGEADPNLVGERGINDLEVGRESVEDAPWIGQGDQSVPREET